MKRIVIALGGNAILTSDPTAIGQENAVKKTIKKIKEYINSKNEKVELVITNGNGPQVGNLVLQGLNGSSQENPAMPLDVDVAMTEGQIGYWLTNALSDNNLPNVAITTRVIVDPKDPAFENPTKPIGPFYENLDQVQKQYPDWVFNEDSGRGYRRVVPSPKPLSIMEVKQINNLLASGNIVNAGGGGGIPVIKDDNAIEGIEAVIDKDFTSAKIAELLHADELIILTAVRQAAINFNKPNQKELTYANIDELNKYLNENQFGKGSMAPKIQAAMQFAEKTGKQAVITSLDNVADFEKNKEATFISK